MASTPSPRSTPLQRATASAEHSPFSGPAPTSVPDHAIPSHSLDQARNSKEFVPPWRRPTLATTGDGDSARRPSVQFVPQVQTGSNPNSRSSSAQPPAIRTTKAHSVATSYGRRRMSSPPPPAQYRPSVSFDTFSNPSASDFSLTLNRKHKDYVYTKRSRTFLCGTDTNEYSDTALEWLIDELIDDGDEIVCLRVVEKDSKDAYRWQGGQGEKGYHKEAERFLEGIEKKNADDRAINLILEFAVGKVHDMIQRMIRIYEPAMLVVGTRGRSLTGYSGLLSSGSVSKYCLQYSPVPVIVVRPSSKREKKKRKRLQDPTRTGYRDILDKSEDTARGKGGHMLDQSNRLSTIGVELGALGNLGAHSADEEARLVAQAIGYRAPVGATGGAERTGSLSRIVSGGSMSSNRRSSAGSTAEDAQSPPDLGRLLQSPNLRHTEDHGHSDDEVSDMEEEEEEEEEQEMRPEDEAALLAYERAQKIVEEEKAEAEARARRSEGRSRSRRRDDSNEEGAGAAVLGLLGQLDRGLIK